MRIAVVLCFLAFVVIIHAQSETLLTCAASTTTISLTQVYGVYKFQPAGSYPATTTCQWLFQVESSSRITFEVTNIYVHCGDVLKFFDGTTSSSSSFGGSVCCSGSCGATKPKETTTGNSLFVQFITDSTTNADELGFTVAVIAGTEYPHCKMSGESVTISLTVLPEIPVTSPLFPAPYDLNYDCTITIHYPPGKVRLDFLYAELESFGGSCMDYIEIHDGDSISSPSLARTCDAVPPVLSFTSTGSYLTIKFSSDNQEVKTGFYANAIAVDLPEVATTTPKTKRPCICRPPFLKNTQKSPFHVVPGMRGRLARGRKTRETT
ncbi:exoskeleton protein RP43-like [Ostrea edulis]|uniref:exoskeleton protein RP43-like n=1 Tax=Ostrea edulis TaxID=37623 RepID=UPI0024AF1B9C|nr:exoskeleton protein RP43-like [Ostrea edulis]